MRRASLAGVAQSVRAPACHAGGRGFESRHSRHVPAVAMVATARLPLMRIGPQSPPRKPMSASVLAEIGLVLTLILANGALALSELSIVSSRPSRLKTMVDRQV